MKPDYLSRHKGYRSEDGSRIVEHINMLELMYESTTDILVAQALLAGARFELADNGEVRYRLFLDTYDAGGWRNKTRAALAANLIIGLPLPERVTP